MQRFGRIFAAALCCALLAACGANQAAPTSAPAAGQAATGSPQGTPATSAPAATAAPTEPAKATATAQPTSGFEGLLDNKGQTIALTLTGGEDAGSYDVTTKDGACSYGLAEAASWGNQYSIATTDPKAFSSLQLIAANVDAASGTDQFMTTVSFGELFSSTGRNYEIKTLDGAGSGSGTVTVDDRGETATIRIQGETAEGVGIDATIECLSVIRLGDAPGGEGEPAGESAIDLTISGGDLAGEYAAILSGETSGCGAGAGNSSVLIESLEEGQRDASYTFEYLDEEAGGPVRWIQLLAAEAADGPTQSFYLDIDDQNFYLENLAGGDGAGTVAVEDTGDSLVFTLDVKNADGVSVAGTITCKSISR